MLPFSEDPNKSQFLADAIAPIFGRSVSVSSKSEYSLLTPAAVVVSLCHVLRLGGAVTVCLSETPFFPFHRIQLDAFSLLPTNIPKLWSFTMMRVPNGFVARSQLGLLFLQHLLHPPLQVLDRKSVV